MIDFKDYIRFNQGKQVLISTTSGQYNGTLLGNVPDEKGDIIALVLKQYFHRIEVPAEEILNIRLTEF